MRYRPEEFQRDFWPKIGRRISSRRKQMKMSRDMFSSLIGTGEKDLGQLERGEHGCSVARLVLIAKTLNLSLDELVLGKNENSKDSAQPTSMREYIDLLLANCTEIQLNSLYHVLLAIMPYIPTDNER